MKKYYLLAISVIALGFTACMDTNAPKKLTNADITFKVKSGTKTSIPTVEFTKEAITGEKGDTLYMLVTNKDSLPYLTNPDSLVPIISGTRLSSIKVITKDTTIKNFNASKPDTISFRDTVQIITTAEDENTTRTFKVVINIHQHDPDLYTWTPQGSEIYSDNAVAEKLVFFDSLLLYVKTAVDVKLFTSKEGANWTPRTLTNFPNSFDIKYIVRNKDKLYIAENQEVYVSSDGISWTKNDVTNSTIHHLAFALNGQVFGVSGNPNVLQILDTVSMSWSRTLPLPSNFPVENEGIFVSNGVSGNERVFVVGGKNVGGNLLNTVWSSENGSYWTNLASRDVFSPRIDIAVVQYDKVLMLFGGRDESGILGLNNYFAISPDYGVSWRMPYSNMVMPIDLTPRFNCQVVVNDDKTKIYFVGGQNDYGFTKDAWVVMKNSVLWETMK